MKRWPLMLLVILLLTSALVFLTGRSALLLAPILWLLGNKVIHSVSKERPFKASVRFVIASFAAVGCSVVVEATRALRFFRMQEFGAGGPISIIAPCCLVIYWLEDSYALMALQGVAQTIVRAVVSLICRVLPQSDWVTRTRWHTFGLTQRTARSASHGRLGAFCFSESCFRSTRRGSCYRRASVAKVLVNLQW